MGKFYSDRSELVVKANRFASEKHNGQYRKLSGLCYIIHPRRVAVLVEDNGGTEEMIMAALLHDTVEDCDVTLLELEQLFGANVSELVMWLTNPSKKFPELSRAERKLMDLNFIKAAPDEAKLIKLCDRLDNVKDMHSADDKWKRKYVAESKDLVQEIGHAHLELRNALLQAICDLEKTIR